MYAQHLVRTSALKYRLIFIVMLYTAAEPHHSLLSPAPQLHARRALIKPQPKQAMPWFFLGKPGHEKQQHGSSIPSAHMTAQAHMPLLVLAVVIVLAQHDWNQLFQKQSLK